MNRALIIEWVKRLQPVLIVAALCLAIGLAIWLLPQRGAAVVAGVGLGGLICFYLFGAATEATILALLWIFMAVAADAAYAKLNDQQPVTLANAFMRVVDAIVKLVEPLLRDFGAASDPRAKVVASAVPDFVWAAILAFIVFTITRLSMMGGSRR